MLENAAQLLISELMLILDEPYDKVEDTVKNMIKD
jgi:hypothetical protein